MSVDCARNNLKTVYDAVKFMTSIQQKSEEVIDEYINKLQKCFKLVERLQTMDVHKIGIYGAGIHGEVLYEWIDGVSKAQGKQEYDFFVCDSNPNLYGKKLCGKVEITDLDSLIQQKPDVILIGSNPFQEVIFNTVNKKFNIEGLGIQVIKLYQPGDENYFDIFM